MANSITIIGSGVFATAVGCNLVSSLENKVTLFVRDEAQINEINSTRHNSKYLPDYKLPKALKASNDVNLLSKSQFIFLAIPAKQIIPFVEKNKDIFLKSAILINLAKGLDDTYFTLNEGLEKLLPNHSIGALKGPNFARSLLNYSPSAMTLAFNRNGKDNFDKTAPIFNDSRINLEYWDNINEIELISALKNIYAIIMGLCDGLNDNPNTRFMIVTKIIKDMQYILQKLGMNKEVIFTYAGIGDLLLTSLNDMSRNRTLGLLIGRGFNFKEGITGPVLEGLRTAQLISNKIGGNLLTHTIFSKINAVLDGQMKAEDFYLALTKQEKAK